MTITKEEFKLLSNNAKWELLEDWIIGMIDMKLWSY